MLQAKKIKKNSIYLYIEFDLFFLYSWLRVADIESKTNCDEEGRDGKKGWREVERENIELEKCERDQKRDR